MDTFEIRGDCIALNQLLKVLGWVDSGGMAKQVIQDGLVRVDGVIELRKRCKLRPGQVVELAGQRVELRALQPGT